MDYPSTVLFITEGSQDRNSKSKNLLAGADAEAMEEYWLAPHGLLSLLSYNTQDHQSRDVTTYNGLSSQLTLIEKCHTAGSHKGISSTEVPSLMTCLSHVDT